MKPIHLIFVAILLVIVLFEILLITSTIFIKIGQPINEKREIKKLSQLTIDEIKAPSLYYNFKWQKIDTATQDSLYNSLKKKLKASHNDLISSITNPGEEWVSTQPKEGDLEKYYEDFAKSSDWQDKNSLYGLLLSPIFKSESNENIWGYFKIAYNTARFLVISKSQISKTSGKVATTCPCNYKYKIFISRIIALDEIKN
ncbi:MAG: hypothetical protein ACMG5Z_08900 [Luteimonas sp.]